TGATVCEHVSKQLPSQPLTERYLNGLVPPELSQRRVTRLFRVHPRVDVLLRLHFDVRTHLLVHLRVELALLKQRAESNLKFSPPIHGSLNRYSVEALNRFNASTLLT